VTHPGHLSDEELSDLVDGTGRPEVADHAAACAACSSRLDGWRVTVARLRLSAPSPAPAGAREAAVGAALAAVPFPALPEAGRRRRQWAAGLAAAAAVAGLVVAGTQMVGIGHSTHPTATRTATQAAGSSTTDRVRLGVLDSPQAVGTAVQRALSVRSLVGGSSSADASSVAAGRGSGAVASGAQATSGAAGGVGPVPATAAVPATAPVLATPALPDGCRLPGSVVPAGSALLLAGDAVYRGVPAQVYAFWTGHQAVAVVIRQAGCALLAQTRI